MVFENNNVTVLKNNNVKLAYVFLFYDQSDLIVNGINFFWGTFF